MSTYSKRFYLLVAQPKPVIVTTEQPKVVTVVPPIAVVTSPVEIEPASVVATIPIADTTSNESGPRVAGARRSTERIRKKSTSSTADNEITGSNSSNEQ